MEKFALIEDVDDGFEKAAEKISMVEGDLTVVKNSLKTISSALNAYGKAIRNGIDGSYSGFWQNDEQAKQFGTLVMSLIKNKDLSSNSNADGGALVPEQLMSRMIDMLGVYGKFRQNATLVKIGTSGIRVPKMTSDLTIYSPGEGREISKSDINFGLVGMVVKKFACMSVISTELEEDAIVGVGEIVAKSMARSMAKKEDLIAFSGDGTFEYFGMIGIRHALRAVDATIANIAGLQVASGNAYGEITLDDFEGLISRLPDDVDDSAKWFVNKKFFYSVMHKLARAAGAADMFNILTAQKTRYFMGYPVEFISAMPSVAANSQICAILGDLSMGAYLGERRELRIERSNDVFFTNDQIAIRGTERIDIVPFGVGDTVNPGPIVGLITAAA